MAGGATPLLDQPSLQSTAPLYQAGHVMAAPLSPLQKARMVLAQFLSEKDIRVIESSHSNLQAMEQLAKIMKRKISTPEEAFPLIETYNTFRKASNEPPLTTKDAAYVLNTASLNTLSTGQNIKWTAGIVKSKMDQANQAIQSSIASAISAIGKVKSENASVLDTTPRPFPSFVPPVVSNSMVQVPQQSYVPRPDIASVQQGTELQQYQFPEVPVHRPLMYRSAPRLSATPPHPSTSSLNARPTMLGGPTFGQPPSQAVPSFGQPPQLTPMAPPPFKPVRAAVSRPLNYKDFEDAAGKKKGTDELANLVKRRNLSANEVLQLMVNYEKYCQSNDKAFFSGAEVAWILTAAGLFRESKPEKSVKWNASSARAEITRLSQSNP